MSRKKTLAQKRKERLRRLSGGYGEKQVRQKENASSSRGYSPYKPKGSGSSLARSPAASSPPMKKRKLSSRISEDEDLDADDDLSSDISFGRSSPEEEKEKEKAVIGLEENKDATKSRFGDGHSTGAAKKSVFAETENSISEEAIDESEAMIRSEQGSERGDRHKEVPAHEVEAVRKESVISHGSSRSLFREESARARDTSLGSPFLSERSFVSLSSRRTRSREARDPDYNPGEEEIHERENGVVDMYAPRGLGDETDPLRRAFNAQQEYARKNAKMNHRLLRKRSITRLRY